MVAAHALTTATTKHASELEQWQAIQLDQLDKSNSCDYDNGTLLVAERLSTRQLILL